LRQSARVTTSRWVALSLLRAVREGELLDPAFARLAPQLAVRDRAWVQELVYGTFRLRGRLDFLLSRFARRPIGQLEPDVLDVLRLGAYQLLEMHGVPAYAAVSQSVEMVKKVSGRAATGFVNGVLQSLRRDQEEAPPSSSTEIARDLTEWGSHPDWLVERWLRIFGLAETTALVAANNQRPALFLRPIGVSADDAIARLRADGMVAEPVSHVSPGLQLVSGDVVRALQLIPAVVQDPAAMLVVQFAAPAGGPVADLCAAPGGKALVMTEEADETASARARFVVAGDISFARLQKLRSNAQRIGADNIGFLNADARQLPLRPLSQALLDVPCTGTGTLRRHPDGKWRLGPQDLRALVELQREILDAAAAWIAPGGLLVYSTCSLEPEENDQQVETFLKRHEAFTLEAPPPMDARWLDGEVLRVLPQKHGFDGAFAARLRRAA
jgi:16S rRNA (cytosine967-C5)-methyltransferase